MEDRYPTEEELERIQNWDCIPEGSMHQLIEFCCSIWWNPDWGWHVEDDDYCISTGGWSGNESIIAALTQNFVFWSLCMKSHRWGGHYFFCLDSSHRHGLCSACSGTGLLESEGT